MNVRHPPVSKLAGGPYGQTCGNRHRRDTAGGGRQMRAAFAFAVLVTISACQQTESMTSSGPQTTGNPQSPSLALRLDAPKETPAAAAIPLKLTLRNTGTEPAQVMLGGRPPHDFVITSADGARTWRWSDGNAAQMILEMRPLKPGEQIAYDVEWVVKDRDGRSPPPGGYLIKGVLNMDPPDTLETAPAEFTITTG